MNITLTSGALVWDFITLLRAVTLAALVVKERRGLGGGGSDLDAGGVAAGGAAGGVSAARVPQISRLQLTSFGAAI